MCLWQKLAYLSSWAFDLAEYWTVFECDLNFFSDADVNSWIILFDFCFEEFKADFKKNIFVEYWTVCDSDINSLDNN